MNAQQLIMLARVKLYANRIGCSTAGSMVSKLLGTDDDGLLRVAVYANKVGCYEVVDSIADKLTEPMSDDDKIHAAIAKYSQKYKPEKIPLIRCIRELGIPAVAGLKDAKEWIEAHYVCVYENSYSSDRTMVMRTK